MKQPMSAKEWYYNQLSKQSGKTMANFEIAEKYSTYLLKHHLEQFAEECKFYTLQYTDLVPTEDIDQTLTDYLTKNNIV